MNSVETRADMTVSKFSLILFDFDKSDIPEENIAILKKFVAPAIKGNSKVKIFGYTDKIGPDLYNKTLSTDRANAVRDILQTQIPDAMYEAFGRGEDVPIFDNDIATGRLLSRTVQIYVETPR
jgi:outer membrane protein OmpA-like peptidoglycan-associated protein